MNLVYGLSQKPTLGPLLIDVIIFAFISLSLWIFLLQPENILCLTKAGNRIKIIDFGLARFYDPEKKLQVLFGTPEFVAPEVVNFDQIGYGTDMWSVGVICYVL